MRYVSWNVNGIKACWNKGLKEFIDSCEADIICLQETKLPERFMPLAERDYFSFWSFAERKGYSGTVCLCKREPIDVIYGIENEKFDTEGRAITLEYDGYYLVNCYVPNSKGSLKRFYYRMDWDEAFREYVCGLKAKKPVIICGDFNVAYEYIDIYPENLRNEENPSGFLDEERDGLRQLLDSGFTDTFRCLYPDKQGAYSWWSQRLYKRKENRGWRIDYFLVSEELSGNILDAGMYSEIEGSDHCPIFLETLDE